VLETTANVALIQIMGLVVASYLVLQTCFFLIQKKTTTTALIQNTLVLLSGYFLISTTVHPWYIISLLLLTVFTNYKFARVWSYTLIFSYFAYNQFSVNETWYMLCLEYVPVISILIWELYHQNYAQKLEHH
jgi:hypothetical protein